MDKEISYTIEQNKKSNFYLSFVSLPKAKRFAIETIYAFCRITDDIVDEGENDEEKHDRLLQWTDELKLSLYGDSNYSILNHLAAIIQKFHIPVDLFYELISGMEMDLTQKRYETFEELKTYCYRVASTVGLICAEVFGYRKETTKEYAVNLGIALQLTNILRDIKDDAQRGRIYIPLEDLHRFGYTEEELLRCEYNENFIALMKFECNRARSFFQKAKVHLAEEDKPIFTAARIMGNIYYLLLKQIERKNYDVFTQRIRLASPYKLMVVWVLHLRKRIRFNIHKVIRMELPA
ncbi:MAG: presqualene diphosphate synthase HpnD [Bacteroidetes bacterium]|nr:presqualene diphosphate synthase HpnD [Bacteroidota bacterium]HOV98725.1 presqualene diphosphate synthase HpnD [Bacteroidota bacterium]